MHAAIHWPSMVETNLLPMAVDYAGYHHNHMPRPSVGMLAPIDLLLKTQSARTHFHDMHVWGCSCYVLDPQLQDGHKLPKWKPRSRRGMFIGGSPRHSSLVPLVLNPRTGKSLLSSMSSLTIGSQMFCLLALTMPSSHRCGKLFSPIHAITTCFYDHDAISLSDDWTDPRLQHVLDNHQHQLN